MADDDYNVFRGEDGQWRAKKQSATRSSVVADTQKEAFERARDLAKQSGAEVSIHGVDGKIRDKHSYGNDPRNIPG